MREANKGENGFHRIKGRKTKKILTEEKLDEERRKGG